MSRERSVALTLLLMTVISTALAANHRPPESAVAKPERKKPPARATGPLRVLRLNPRYFTDGSGR